MDWKISIEERTKHDASFMQLGPVNGLLTGEKAREFFLKSNLPTPILGQIWGLADLNKDGKLDKKEFSIACCLIKKTLTNGAASLPTTLPSSLLIEPIISPAQQPQSNSPLFNATFPGNPSPVTPTTQQPNLFPGLSVSNLTPSLNNQSSQPRMLSTPQSQSNLVSTSGISMSMSSLVPGSMPTSFTQANMNYNRALVPYPKAIVPYPNTGFNGYNSPSLMSNGYGYSITPPVQRAIEYHKSSINSSNSFRLPNPLAPIPSTSRMKYSQMFQSNDQGSTGYLSGQAAKTLLLQVGLPQPTLVQIWNLADYDKDGKLSLEEFIIAMHLCDFAKAGNTLPMALPIELQPQRAKTATLPMTSSPSPVFNSPPQGQQQPPAGDASSAEKNKTGYSFEDKRRENFDRGAAILEAKRQMLREQEERERKEREEKERVENERKQRIREEQEKRRQEEIQRQMERQRVLDAQREEERRKIFEQREAARNELLKQQRAEWERQKKQELETQKLKLQEQLNTLKAKDKNLEYDMQNLNEKIAAYRTKINDTQVNLNGLNNQLEMTRKSYLMKQSEMEQRQRELHEYQQSLARMRQEKGVLGERQGGLRMDMSAPHGDEFGRSNRELEAKQQTIQQLKSEMERMEQQISTTRNQMQGVKHELAESKTNETNFYRENDRLTQLIDLKRPGHMKANTSFGQSAELANAAAAHVAFKPSLSANNIRSATPKENYDAFKEEITKIQQSAALINSSTQQFLNGSVASSPAQQPQQLDPFASVSDPFNANSHMLQQTQPQQQQRSANFSGADWTNFNSDPFASTGSTDPFSSQPMAAATASHSNSFQSGFMNQPQPQANSFQSAFMNSSLATSSSDFNGFGADDNWATAAFAASTTNATSSTTTTTTTSTTNNNTRPASTTTSTVSSPKAIATAVVDAKQSPVKSAAVATASTTTSTSNNQNDSSNFGANWAHFDDGATTTNQSVTSPMRDPFAAGSDPFGSSAAAKSPQAGAGQQQANFSADWGNAFNKSDPFAADDNWAASAANTATNTNVTSPTANAPRGFDTATNNWASFNDDVPLNVVKFRAEYQFDASREDELSIQIGDMINVDTQVSTDEGWLYGECNGRVGVFPAAFTVKYSDWEAAMQQQQAFPQQGQQQQQQMYNSQSNQSLTSPRGAPKIPTSGSFRSNKSFSASQSFPNQAALNSNLNNTQLSDIKNYFISIYPYTSTEIGDLVFREFEIINVIDQNEDWLTGQIVGTGSGPANPLRAGIFPSNFVIKFDFPIEYIGKYTIGMATEAYQAANGGELSLNPAESQLIAIKKVSPDGQWTYGESYDVNRTLKKGWFPIQSALSLIDAGVAPLLVPTSNATSPTTSANNVAASNSMGNIKTAPNSVSLNTSTKSPSVSSISSTPPPPTANSAKVASPPPVAPTTTQSSTPTINTTTRNADPSTSEPTTKANTPTNTNTNTNSTSSSSSASTATTKTKVSNVDASTPSAAAAASSSSTGSTNNNSNKANASSKANSNDETTALDDDSNCASVCLNDTSILSDSNGFTCNNNQNSNNNDEHTDSVALAQAESFFESPISEPISSPSEASLVVAARQTLDLDIGFEKAKAEAVLNEALANSDSLYKLCKELNKDSSCEFSEAEPLEELYISEEHVSSTPKPSATVKKPTSQEASEAAKTSGPGPKQEPEPEKVATASSNDEAASTQPQLPSGVIDQVVALYDFASTTPETIGFPKDAVINIIEKSGDWWLGEYQGKMGLLPYNYVQSILTGETTATEENNIQDKSYLEKIRADFKRKSLSNSSATQQQQRNSLQNTTDEETQQNYDLEDSSFEEFNDDSLSTDYETTTSRMDTPSRGSTDYYNHRIELNGSHGKLTSNKSLMPKEELRLNVLNEIVETERKYVRDLKFIIEYYKTPLRTNRILTRPEIDTMFVNLDELVALNTKFSNSLLMRSAQAKQANNEFPCFGDLFIEYLPRMHVYSRFVSSKRFSEDLILEKMKNSPEFQAFISKNSNASDFLLKKMLLLPMQRLTQYQMLIDKLNKSLSGTDSVEYRDMLEASKLTVELIKSINNEVGKIDDLERLEWLESHVNIKDAKGFKFVSHTNIMGPRCILYYGPLVKENEFNKGKDLYGFLFNDSLLLVEAHESVHNEVFKTKKLNPLNMYKQPMLLDQIANVQSKMNSQNISESTFQITAAGKEMFFRTTNPTLKNEWIKQLLKSIDTYRQKKSLIKNSVVTSTIYQREPVGRFLLVIMEAQDLHQTEHEPPKAFCVVEMGGKKFNSQKIDSANPKWNLSMQFSVYDVNRDVLSINVHDSKQFTPNLFLGKIDIRMMNIYRDQMKENQENGPVPITRCFRMSGGQSGKLMLKMSLSIFN